jgi:hypothetical protein
MTMTSKQKLAIAAVESGGLSIFFQVMETRNIHITQRLVYDKVLSFNVEYIEYRYSEKYSLFYSKRKHQDNRQEMAIGFYSFFT